MFKNAVVVIFISFYVTAINCRDIPHQVQAITVGWRETCMKESGVSQEIIDEAHEGRFSEARELQCYMACLLNQQNWFLPTGYLDIERLVAFIPHDLLDEYEQAARDCSHLIGVDNCDTAHKLHKCFHSIKLDDYFLV